MPPLRAVHDSVRMVERPGQELLVGEPCVDIETLAGKGRAVLAGRKRPASTRLAVKPAFPARCSSASWCQIGRDADLPPLSEPLRLRSELVCEEDDRRRAQGPLALPLVAQQVLGPARNHRLA